MTTEPTRHDPDDALLEGLFAQARAVPPPAVPDALLARVLADADAAMPRPGVPQAVSQRPAVGWFASLIAAVGGRGAVAGMAAAGLAGVWIGFAEPVQIPFVSGVPIDTVELFPADPDLWGDILATDPAQEG